MKKLLLSIIAVAGMAIAANAQEFGFKTGNVLLEGNINYNSTNNKDSKDKQSSFGFSPKVGYFLSDKFAVGAEISLNSTKQEDYSGVADIDKENTFAVGVFGRYYFLEIGKRFKTYTEAGVAILSVKNESKNGTVTTESKSNGFGINAGLGANYFLTEK